MRRLHADVIIAMPDDLFKSARRAICIKNDMGLEPSYQQFYCPSFHTLTPQCDLGRLFQGFDMTTDTDLHRIFSTVKTIALVGWSPKADRPSHRVALYLRDKGYRVIPVNPGQAGMDSGLGEVVRASLTDIDTSIDMVDIFRRSEEVAPIVEDALRSGVKVIWMQLGVQDDRAAALARAQGADVVMDRCPAIEMPRLGL